MRYDDRIANSIDAGLGKENLYIRAVEIIKDHGNDTLFIQNMWAIYLGLAESKEVVQKLGLNAGVCKSFKQEISKKYYNKFIDGIDTESEQYEDVIQTQYDKMDRGEEAFLTFHDRNSYSRGEGFVNVEHDRKFKEKIKTYSLRSFLFNRLYEMMLTQLISKHLIDEIGDEYFVKAYKTSTFDDTISGIDIIVSLKNKKTNYRYNIGIDHICGVSERAIDKKGSKKKALCGEFCSSVGGKRYRTIPRIVWNSNPGISFLLFEWYIHEIASGTIPDTNTLQEKYFAIIDENPILYKKSVERDLGFDYNVANFKETLTETLMN